VIDFWKKIKVKAEEIGLDSAYFVQFEQNDGPLCQIKNTGLKRCKYFMDIREEAGCFIKIDHSNKEWNNKVFDLVQSCEEEMNKNLGAALSFNKEECSIGLFRNPKDADSIYKFGVQEEEELGLHLIRCFYILTEEVDHVIANSIEEVYK